MNLLSLTLAAAREPYFSRALNLFRQEIERARPRLSWAFLVRDGTLWRSYLCRVAPDAQEEMLRLLGECAGANNPRHWIALPGPRGRQAPRHAFAVHDQAALLLTADDPDFRTAFTLLVHHFRQRDNAGSTDYLTGLANRRGFDEALRQMIHLQQRHRFDFSVGLLDLDRFKERNDQDGHAAGDACLQSASALLRAALRESDTIARYGGDEFGLILPYADREALPIIARRVARSLETDAGLTGSLGVVTVPAGVELPPPAALMARVDETLYRAKEAAPGGFSWSEWRD
jgi:diguanylate cyclase (GGDEF)-like protein